MSDSYRRKRDHIQLCNEADVVGTDHDGLFSDLILVHDALPELAMEELVLETSFLDHELRVPLMVTGMTGGPPEAGDINAGVARVCAELGIAFGVGSQRAMTRVDDALETFQVRKVAPGLVFFGNIGVAQARDMGVAQVAELVARIEADYLAVHLNPGMELIQPGADADSDFRGGYDIIGRLVDALQGRILVKECGSGLSPRVVRRLQALGVRAVDVSGTGGTSWIKVEALRADEEAAARGQRFADWGLPTAAATALAARIPDIQVVSSGGIDDGLKVAKALALGADLAGCARPVLKGFLAHGEDGVRAVLESFENDLRMAMALTGCRRPEALRRVPRVVGPRLGSWLAVDDTEGEGDQP